MYARKEAWLWSKDGGKGVKKKLQGLIREWKNSSFFFFSRVLIFFIFKSLFWFCLFSPLFSKGSESSFQIWAYNFILFFLGSYFLAFRVHGSWAIPPFYWVPIFSSFQNLFFLGSYFLTFKFMILVEDWLWNESWVLIFYLGFSIFLLAGFFIFWTFVIYGSF